MPRESAFVYHVKALRRLVAQAGASLEPEVVDSIVATRVRHILRQMAEAEAAEAAADYADDTYEGISP